MLRPPCRGVGLAKAGEVSSPRGAVACRRGSLLGGIQACRVGQERSRPPASHVLKGTKWGKSSPSPGVPWQRDPWRTGTGGIPALCSPRTFPSCSGCLS